jgi:LysM repeat protein
MKGNLKAISFLAMMAALVGLCMANQAVAQDSWSYGGVEYKLPVPRDEVQIPADIPATHTVVKGDTLWDIAGHYLNNNFFWPLIWEVNLDQVPNPHLIFPDQVLNLPAATMPAGQPTETAEAGEGEGEEMVATLPETPEPIPLAAIGIVKSSGYISEDKLKGPKIVGSDHDKINLVKGDVVYVSTGAEDGVQPDDRFYVVHTRRAVVDPDTGKKLGYLVNIVAEADLVCVQDETASAVLTKSYSAAQVGDVVVPYYEIEVPEAFPAEAPEPCTEASAEVTGKIVDAYKGIDDALDAVILGHGDVVYIDVGSRDNVVAGDHFHVLKQTDVEGFEQRTAGELFVLRTQERTSTAYITRSSEAIAMGDRVALIK